ncbi:MAG: bifunctional aminoglycoside phosphotransferase/ATP-binding protein [Planctomycetota bacterium]
MAAPLQDQPLVRDLLSPGNLPGSPEHVEFLFTHASLIFRTPSDVYKVKRAKDFGFFDHTTLSAREHSCREELRLNRRTAPEVYLGVLPVRRDARGHSLVRGGEIVDWAVHMRTLPDARNAQTLLHAGRLGPADITAIAASLARFHASLEPLSPAPGALAAAIEENLTQAKAFVPDLVGVRELERLGDLAHAWLARHAEELATRPARDGHGDLRLEHLYLMPRGPVLIDCIEFLDRFRIGDPVLDVAFLAMDLLHEGHAALGEFLLGRFAYETDDYDGYPLVDGYVSYRAFVRAKVAGFVALDRATPARTAARKRREARALFATSGAAQRPRAQPRTLLGVGGGIASGKTTVADALAASLGLASVSADATRKHLAGLPHEARGPASIYSPEATAATQREVLRRAGLVLSSGRDVILDTTFQTAALRRRARALARENGARFLLVECRVPADVARARLAARTGGVSDAREELLERFSAAWEGADELPAGEHLVLDGTRPVDALVTEVRARLADAD